MPLKVYAGKNQASRRYELKFFRAFASTLAAQFKEEGRDGVLLGHPRSLDNEYFQPDVLLITNNIVIIIDFKNFDNATIRLPDENNFNRLEWKSVSNRGETTVKGGASPNPFAQLQKQKERMREVLEVAGADLEIQTCVLFQGDIRLEGDVPGKYQAFFSIATGFDYPNVLNDSINVGSTRTFTDFDSLVSRFEVTRFRDYPAISPDNLVAASSLAETSQQKQRAIDAERLAASRLKEAEKLVADAESQGRSLTEAKQRLDAATHQAEEATAVAKKTQQRFDEKRHQLELAHLYTEQKKADVASQQSKTRRALLGLVALLIVSLVVVAGVVAIGNYQAEQSSQLHADRAAGKVCIPASDAGEFIGTSDACVTFTVGHVGADKGLVFVQERFKDVFTALVYSDKTKISKDDATALFKGKTIEVRGDIIAYNGKPEIKVVNSSQITVVE